MSGELFSRVHISLTSMLQLQRAGKDIREPLNVLSILISDGKSLVDGSEFTAIRSACVVALRLLADASLRNGTYKANKTLFAEIILHLFEVEDVAIRTSGCNSSLGWQKHIRPLLAILISDVTGSNHEAHAMLTAVQLFCDAILQSTDFRIGLFSKPSLSVLAKLVTSCLENAENSNRNPETRLICLEIIKSLSCCAESVDSFSLLLPGISSRLVSIVTKSSSENGKLLVASLELMSSFILLCLNDARNLLESEDATSEINEDWCQKTVANLTKMLASVSSCLVVHRDAEVRFQLFRTLSSIYIACHKAFENNLDVILYDVVLLLVADPSIKIQDEVSTFLPSLRSDSRFTTHLYDKIMLISDRMPLSARQSTDPNIMLQQLNSALSIGPSSSDYSSWCTSLGPVFTSIRALSLSIRFDLKRVRINSSYSSSTSVQGLLRAIPLQYGLKFEEINKFCHHLAEKVGIKALELIYEDLGRSARQDVASYMFLGALIISSLQPSDYFNDILHVLGEECSELLDNLPHQSPLSDSKLNDESQSVSLDTVLGVCSLACLTSIFICLIKGRKDTEQHLLLMKNLYSILGLCARNDWILRDSAISAINIIAQSQNMTTGQLLCDNASYIVSSVSVACLSPSSHLNSPSVLASVIDLVDDPAIFDQLRHSVLAMLFALDEYNQEHCLAILRMLRSFVQGMLRWFPEEKAEPIPAKEVVETEEDMDVTEELAQAMEDEPKPPVPETVKTVEQLLLRTKHLIASHHSPMQIVALEIMKYGLRFVRNFDDILLPMIHQNWLSLIGRMSEDNLYIRIPAFEVIREMAIISRSFVQRRIRLELWPKIVSFMCKEAAKGGRVYQHSPAFKYQQAVLEGMFDIWSSIDMESDEWLEVQKVLSLYDSIGSHPILKDLAKTSFTHLEAFYNKKAT